MLITQKTLYYRAAVLYLILLVMDICLKADTEYALLTIVKQHYSPVRVANFSQLRELLHVKCFCVTLLVVFLFHIHVLSKS